LYATGGYTEARFESSFNGDFFDGVSRDRTFSGWFAGAGIDTRLAASNWFLRLEYRYSQFDSETVARLDEFTTAEVEPHMHTARLTLTYKFTPQPWGGWGGGLGGWAPNSWGR
jgi:opacity protein-like surface antigen